MGCKNTKKLLTFAASLPRVKNESNPAVFMASVDGCFMHEPTKAIHRGAHA